MQEVSSFVTELVSRALLKICYSVGIVMPGGADMTVRTFTAILRQEGNLYVAECPEVGTASQGQTVEEAIANLKEATELYLEEFPLPEAGRTILTTFEATYAA